MKFSLKTLLISMWVLGFASCTHQQVVANQSMVGSPFKMILRTWDHYYLDTLLREQLVGSLKKYPAFDVVWLAPKGDDCLDYRLESHVGCADSMNILVNELRQLGLQVGIEGLTIGHFDNPNSINKISYGKTDYRGIAPPWKSAVGFLGEQTMIQSCPRQSDFLDFIGKYYALYAEKIHPDYIWLDDDFRLNNHQPATLICFCDTCINQFNKEVGGDYTLETLTKGLEDNKDNGLLREQWRKFGQESLSGIVRSIGRSVHKVSPETHIGIENAFNRTLPVTGPSNNLSFDVIKEETGYPAACRPGAGFYDDHEPRGMIAKAYELARQIRRLNSNVLEIPPEIECYHHTSSGKSPRGICLESMLYMAMGGNQLSYAIIGSADEPMDWYASHYFKYLLDWRNDFKRYADFNYGTEPGGLDSYISPSILDRLKYKNTGKADWEYYTWTLNNSGNMVNDLAVLGIPFSPEGHYASGYILDKEAVETLSQEEMERFCAKGLILDEDGWKIYQLLGGDKEWKLVDAPSNIGNARFYVTDKGGRLAVLPTYSAANVNIKRRSELLAVADWVSFGKLPAIIETQAQMVAIPRIDKDNHLRSVLLLNCSISDQGETTIRLRGCSDKTKFIYHEHGKSDVTLTLKKDGQDILVTVPGVDDWMVGWISIE
ncbi:MAG: hypothetical protein ACTTJK_06055 [Phocaeicola sp.]|uniref:hypothetical protein n=1 Tax=Phocaeicola TaxID=909656 RepID=UPI00234FA1A3|nr:hypothetical protein [Phocaeicola oris]MCE2615917.1 hypothetical protein [Phocaeicola oris]